MSKINSELKKQGLKESTGVMMSIAKKPPVKPGTSRRRRRWDVGGGGGSFGIIRIFCVP